MSLFFKKIVSSQGFNWVVAFIILINCILIGVEQSFQSEIITWIQDFCIVLFVVEIIFRWFARETISAFFTSIWNLVDLVLILVSLVPETLFENSDLLTAFRIVRVIRIMQVGKGVSGNYCHV